MYIYICICIYIYRDVYTRKLHDSLALRLICLYNPEGPTYTTIMELGAQNQNRDGFFGGGLIPYIVYMDPLGNLLTFG